MDRDQFHRDRLTGVGGSDIHHLFNLEPYGCQRRLWYDKCEVTADHPQPTTPAMERGTAMEPLIVRMYARGTDRDVSHAPMHRHAEDPWLIVHPDGLIADEGRPDYGVLECKCPGLREFAKLKRSGIPDSWTLQLQHAMLVTGSAWGSIAILQAEQWAFLTFDVAADRGLQAEIRSAARRLWGRVENGRGGEDTAPDRLPPSDPRCRSCPWRTTCQGVALLASVEPVPEGGDYAYDEALTPLVEDYLIVRRLAEEATELLTASADRLREAVGNRPGIRTDGTRVHYRPSERVTLDTGRLRKDHPELCHDYERTSIVRPLRVVSL